MEQDPGLLKLKLTSENLFSTTEFRPSRDHATILKTFYRDRKVWRKQMNNLMKFGPLAPQTMFIQGWYHDTLPLRISNYRKYLRICLKKVFDFENEGETLNLDYLLS